MSLTAEDQLTLATVIAEQNERIASLKARVKELEEDQQQDIHIDRHIAEMVEIETKSLKERITTLEAQLESINKAMTDREYVKEKLEARLEGMGILEQKRIARLAELEVDKLKLQATVDHLDALCHTRDARVKVLETLEPEYKRLVNKLEELEAELAASKSSQDVINLLEDKGFSEQQIEDARDYIAKAGQHYGGSQKHK